MSGHSAICTTDDFAYSSQLYRLWSAHSFENFNLVEQHFWHCKSSLLIRGPNRCSNVGDSLFGDGEPLSSVDSSLFMWFTNPPEMRTVYKCAKYFKPNLANRIQGFEENPSNNVIQIVHIGQYSPDPPVQATLKHLC